MLNLSYFFIISLVTRWRWRWRLLLSFVVSIGDYQWQILNDKFRVIKIAFLRRRQVRTTQHATVNTLEVHREKLLTLKVNWPVQQTSLFCDWTLKKLMYHCNRTLNGTLNDVSLIIAKLFIFRKYVVNKVSSIADIQ